MQRLCAWCGCKITEFPVENSSNPISHGICRNCARKMFSEMGEPMEDYLNRFSIPILVVDRAEEILAANLKARERVRFRPGQGNPKVGDVVECAHASKPGGCGKTLHCRTCAIRNAILYTQKTGLPMLNVPAFPDFQQFDKEPKVTLRISTEKVGEVVIVKIEENVDPSDSA